MNPDYRHSWRVGLISSYICQTTSATSAPIMAKLNLSGCCCTLRCDDPYEYHSCISLYSTHQLFIVSNITMPFAATAFGMISEEGMMQWRLVLG